MTTLLLLCVPLVCSMILVMILVKLLNKQMAQNKEIVETLSNQNLSLLDLVTKQNNLILSKDPLTFQQLQVMTSQVSSEPGVVNMSDLDEAERWIDAHGGMAEVGEEVYDPDGFAAQQRLFGPNSS